VSILYARVTEGSVVLQPVKPPPCCLLVRKVDGPCDGGIAGDEFLDQLAMQVVAEDPKAGSLALYTVTSILVAPGGRRSLPMKNSVGLLPTRAIPIVGWILIVAMLSMGSVKLRAVMH